MIIIILISVWKASCPPACRWCPAWSRPRRPRCFPASGPWIVEVITNCGEVSTNSHLMFLALFVKMSSSSVQQSGSCHYFRTEECSDRQSCIELTCRPCWPSPPQWSPSRPRTGDRCPSPPWPAAPPVVRSYILILLFFLQIYTLNSSHQLEDTEHHGLYLVTSANWLVMTLSLSMLHIMVMSSSLSMLSAVM